LKQAELMIDWCAGVLDSGAAGTMESSIAKVAVSEGLFRVADRCVQVLGGTGVSRDTIVEQVFREIRAFRIYDGPTEVHKWSLAKKIQSETRRIGRAKTRPDRHHLVHYRNCRHIRIGNLQHLQGGCSAARSGSRPRVGQ
jgi:acyl-CoA dehydrogenase